MTKKNTTTIFTDGSSRGNPGRGGWGAIVVQENKVTELGGKENHTTNNQMELKAAIGALSFVSLLTPQSSSSFIIHTDSSYLINGITKWIHGWNENDWKTKTKKEVLNRKLWEELSKLVEGKKIEWNYLGGHRGIAGNERCDEIATLFADGRKVALYDGPIKSYPRDILNISLDHEKSKKRTKDRSRSKAKAYSYVSSVDGKTEVHSTWEECEKRVKGKSGAKFKKSLNSPEEKEIIDSWKSS